MMLIEGPEEGVEPSGRDADPEFASPWHSGVPPVEGFEVHRLLLQTLVRITAALARPTDRQILRAVLEQAIVLMDARGAYLAVPTRDGTALDVRVAVGTLASQQGELIPLGGNVEGQAFRTGAVREIQNLGDGRGVHRARTIPLPAGRGIAIPISVGSRPGGLLLLAWPESPTAMPAGAPRRLREHAAVVGAIVGNLRRFAAVWRSAERSDPRRDRVEVPAGKAGGEQAARDLGGVVAEDDRGARRIVLKLQHEVNNPLAIILGQMELLLSEDLADQPEAEVMEGLRTVSQQAQRIARTVRQMAAESPGAEAVTPITEQSDAGFRAIVESMSEGLLVVDAGLVIRYANPAIQAIAGRSSAELVGQPVGTAFSPADAAGRIRAYVEAALSETMDPLEVQLSRQEGQSAWIRLASRPFGMLGGVGGGALCTFTDVTGLKQSEAELRAIALQDPLTGLPNRAMLLERLTNAVARATRHTHPQFGVLFLDMDRLKLVNDSLGHTAGDQLLVAFARRLQASVRPADTVARLGGDEFAILLEDIEETADATRVAERILAGVADPLQVAEHEVATSVSIGIVLSSPAYTAPEQLLRDADIAMYRAKSLGRGRYAIFNQELHRITTSRLREEAELKRALERNEFRLHYQPIVELSTRRLAGLEALLRWEHPDRGLLEPVEFIALAESSNLILPIGRWVLSHACAQLRSWRDRYPARAPKWVAVNLSSKQFLQPGLLAQLQEALRDTSLSPNDLRLEIQESTVSKNSRLASTILDELRSLGVRVNMDDFGTGHSSLGSLHSLAIESLKIDQSVLRDLKMDDQQTRLIRTILTVAEGVGASAIAEGVSTAEQLGELQRMGCQYAQGYLFSRPLTAQAVERLLRSATGGAPGPTAQL